MLQAGLDLSRDRLDVCLLSEHGELVEEFAVKIDACVLAVLSERALVPAIWLPDAAVRRERERARFWLQLVKHRWMLEHRIHSTLITFGKPPP